MPYIKETTGTGEAVDHKLGGTVEKFLDFICFALNCEIFLTMVDKFA